MTQSDQVPARYRSWVFAFAVLALSILSFSKTLDTCAHNHNVDAKDQALRAYVTVRTVNAGVSVLQTADVELGLPFFRVSGEVGQFLDPVNDAAERASTALAWSIGSLFVQGILLDFAALPLVKWIFAASGLLALLCPLLTSIFSVSGSVADSVRRASVRCFVIMGMLRFLVPAFVASSHLASQVLLQERINEDGNAVREMSSRFEGLNGAGSANDTTLIAQDLRDQITGLRENKADLERQREQVTEDFDELPLACRSLRWRCPPEADSLRQERSRLGDEIDAVDDRITEANRNLECIAENGMDCAASQITWITRVREILTKAQEMPTDLLAWGSDLPVRLTNWMISLVVKCIVFPLLFLFLAAKCGAYVIKRTANLRLHVPAR